MSCWDQHNILVVLPYFDCVLKISNNFVKVNSQSQFDIIDFVLIFFFFFYCRDRDVRSLDIFDEKAHPLTVWKVP